MQIANSNFASLKRKRKLRKNIFCFNKAQMRNCKIIFKGRVHCFSMQVGMNKCFLLNPEKNWRRFVLTFSRKTQKTHSTLIPKSNVTELKTRLL